MLLFDTHPGHFATVSIKSHGTVDLICRIARHRAMIVTLGSSIICDHLGNTDGRGWTSLAVMLSHAFLLGGGAVGLAIVGAPDTLAILDELGDAFRLEWAVGVRVEPVARQLIMPTMDWTNIRTHRVLVHAKWRSLAAVGAESIARTLILMVATGWATVVFAPSDRVDLQDAVRALRAAVVVVPHEAGPVAFWAVVVANGWTPGWGFLADLLSLAAIDIDFATTDNLTSFTFYWTMRSTSADTSYAKLFGVTYILSRLKINQ